MSINWVELTSAQTPLPIGEERFVPPARSGQLREASLKISRPITSAGPSERPAMLNLEASGIAYLTDMRFVFVSNSSSSFPTTFKSFSAMYQSILGLKYEQPWWGSNYISFSIVPAPNGGLTGGAGAIVKCELRVDGRGLYEFSAAFEREIEAARQRKLEANTLPAYTPPSQPTADSVRREPNPGPEELPPAYDI